MARIRTLLAAGLGMNLMGGILSCMSDETLLMDDCHERIRNERRRMTDKIDHLVHARTLLDDLRHDPGIRTKLRNCIVSVAEDDQARAE